MSDVSEKYHCSACNTSFFSGPCSCSCHSQIAQAFGKLTLSASGATSSHKAPNYFLIPGDHGLKLTAQRFEAGNVKHEASTPVYDEANWLKAYNARDVAFFRNRAGHCLEHLFAEMRGQDDNDAGGNLGAIGWFQAIMAYVKENDPHLYGAIQGKWRVEPRDKAPTPAFISTPNQCQFNAEWQNANGTVDVPPSFAKRCRNLATVYLKEGARPFRCYEHGSLLDNVIKLTPDVPTGCVGYALPGPTPSFCQARLRGCEKTVFGHITARRWSATYRCRKCLEWGPFADRPTYELLP